jgi:sigma-54 dependent transcriptional regulator, flagellar regulatory protein
MDGDDAEIQIIGQEAKMVAIGELIRRVARSTVSVLITGERGTGKALIARAIHRCSYRTDKPFVAVDCSMIPEPLLARELYGYEPKASAGLGRWVGAFERARGGTILLEEVGSLSPVLQTTLLRMLQEGAIERIGAKSRIPAEVRVLAATRTDVQQMVYAGHFRAELYYRLRGIPMDVPPLRARRGDIPLLVHHFLTCYIQPSSQRTPGISPAAMEALQAYDWPGNVQELESLIKYLVLRTPHERIQWQDLPRELRARHTAQRETLAEHAGHSRPVESPFGPAALQRFLARRPWN